MYRHPSRTILNPTRARDRVFDVCLLAKNNDTLKYCSSRPRLLANWTFALVARVEPLVQARGVESVLARLAGHVRQGHVLRMQNAVADYARLHALELLYVFEYSSTQNEQLAEVKMQRKAKRTRTQSMMHEGVREYTTGTTHDSAPPAPPNSATARLSA